MATKEAPKKKYLVEFDRKPAQTVYARVCWVSDGCLMFADDPDQLETTRAFGRDGWAECTYMGEST